MKLEVIATLVLVTGCGGKKEQDAPTKAGSSATPASGSASGSTAPSVLPARNAPPTAEVLAKFDAACDAGTAAACFDSGMRRAQGMGTARDRVAGAAWLEKGCKRDDAESCGLLAGFVALGEHGIAQDKQRAFELHQKACPKHPPSCRLLAGYYGRGEVVPQDQVKAIAYLEQGCEVSDPAACEDLAQRLAEGSGVTKNVARAVEKAKAACDLATYNCETLGAFQIGGTGVAKDAKQGEALIEKACKSGSKRACEGLEILRGP